MKKKLRWNSAPDISNILTGERDTMVNFLIQLLIFGLLIPKAGATGFPVSRQNLQHLPTASHGPKRVEEGRLGIKISAPYAVVLDKESRKVLYEKKKDLQTPIASITKLMTAVIFLENNPGWDTEVIIQKEAMRDGGRIYIFPGEKVRVEDLFFLMLVASSNEAAVMLARSTGMTQETFVERMNQKARSLGLEHTAFIEPTGIEPANISTAYEIGLFSIYAFQYEEIRKAAQFPFYQFSVLNTGRRVTAPSTNRLLNSYINDKERYSIVGAKTGYIHESQYSFTAEIQSQGRSILVTLFGSPTDEDRWRDIKGLVEWTFENYRWSDS